MQDGHARSSLRVGWVRLRLYPRASQEEHGSRVDAELTNEPNGHSPRGSAVGFGRRGERVRITWLHLLLGYVDFEVGEVRTHDELAAESRSVLNPR